MTANENAASLSVVFSAGDIARRIDALTQEIANRQRETSSPSRLLVVPILRGSFVFAADLIRAMHHHELAPEVDFISLSSYRERMQSSGVVEVVRDIETDVKGRDVLLVDDILESGRTLAFAKDLMVARGAARVNTCVLLEKPGKRTVEIDADFRAFECPDVFVVGYGMDLGHRYRELPYVGRLIHRE